jgi:hypothetical protein
VTPRKKKPAAPGPSLEMGPVLLQIPEAAERAAPGPDLAHARTPGWEHHLEWVPVEGQQAALTRLGLDGWEFCWARDEVRDERRPDPVRGVVHHVRGVVLYLKRRML